MKRKLVPTIIICLILLISCPAFANDIHLLKNQTTNEFQLSLKDRSPKYNLSVGKSFFQFNGLSLENIKTKEGQSIKGIYLTGWVAGSSKKINRLLTLIDNTELNAVVIDVKNIEGEISYESQIGLADKINASLNKIKDIRALLKKCKAHNIYTIARIPVFKDRKLAINPRYSLKFYDLQTKNLKISSNQEWVNPYSREVWKYNVDLAIEAALKGFDEIQFDYIRFPSFFNLSQYKLATAPSDSKIAVINDFVRYASRRLNKYNIPISLDVFGLTTSIDNLGIGQDFKSLAKKVDYISPMVYPSHYGTGVYGLELPETAPYSTVYRSMQDAKKRLNGEVVKLRPWLQDFSLRHRYGVKEIKEQIRAAKEIGLDSWLLWNPSSNYTWQAFLQNRVVGDKDVKTNRTKSNTKANGSSKRSPDRT